MNVADTMRKALPELNKGLDNLRFHLTPECAEEWNENYAIVQGLYYDEVESDYFNHEQFRYDYEQKVKAIFAGCKVTFHWRSQEIEVEGKK